ncbi:hypothetical protein BGZ60DRAFT_419944 [Tricladium varicosporioides]|nr:hypothetical protein BGZ60DRAFT_419944 [Hymenoscyphus varicosporioides]
MPAILNIFPRSVWGWRAYASFGLAYIATDPPSNYSSVTLDIANTGDVTWNATVSNTTDAGVFYIVDSGFSAAGFVSSNTTAPDGALTVGFSMFGSQVVYISGSNLEAQFWAQETGEDGVWALMWNTNGTSQDGSVPIVLKKSAPTAITD